MSGDLLGVKDLCAGYGDLQILKGVSLTVEAGERVLIFGPNGSGKSTLLKTIIGLVHPTAGTVTVNHEDVSRLPPQQIVTRGVSFVPQTENVFTNLTILENLEMGGVLLGREMKRRLADIIDLFPFLGDRRSQAAGSLSGGERQLVAMGRALMLDPSLLVLDEPTAGLAPAAVDEVFCHIRRINSEQRTAVLMVEQNVSKGMENCERGYLLENGLVRLEGPMDLMYDSSEVTDVYLGGSS